MIKAQMMKTTGWRLVAMLPPGECIHYQCSSQPRHWGNGPISAQQITTSWIAALEAASQLNTSDYSAFAQALR
jgi:hypothetical protein